MADKHTSIWKKEISLGKRGKPSAPKAPIAAEEKPSLWKREIKLGRRAASAPDPAQPLDPAPIPSHRDGPVAALSAWLVTSEPESHAEAEHSSSHAPKGPIFEPPPAWDPIPVPELPVVRELPMAPESAAIPESYVPVEPPVSFPTASGELPADLDDNGPIDSSEPGAGFELAEDFEPERAAAFEHAVEPAELGGWSSDWTRGTDPEPESWSKPAWPDDQPGSLDAADVHEQPTEHGPAPILEQPVARDLPTVPPEATTEWRAAAAPVTPSGVEASLPEAEPNEPLQGAALPPGEPEAAVDADEAGWLSIPDAAAAVSGSEPEPVGSGSPEESSVPPVDEAGARTDFVPELEATVVDTKAGSKPSLFKRELHLPRPRLRNSGSAAKARSVAKVKPGGSPHKNVVGLRVGSSQLAAAYVHNNGSAELLQVARTPLVRGIVAGGEVRDPEALASALKAFFAEHKLPRRGVRLGIASNRIGVRMLDVPALADPKLFENSIRFHAQETLPIAVTEAIIDHIVLDDGTGPGQEGMARILLVFAHRELVDRYVEACRRAGLKLAGIDFEAFALLRALTAQRPAGEETRDAVVAVAVGQERTIFAVSDGRICDYTRVLEWGGGSLDVVIARALDLTPSEAEPVKLALSLNGDAAPAHLSDIQVEAARAAIRTELQALGRELVSSLQFYQARPGSLDIGEILLSGGGAQLAGFAAELEHLVGVPVRVGDPYAQVEIGKKLSLPAESGSLAVAIGLGIDV
jgi:type IV pilus assembly protein PilM